MADQQWLVIPEPVAAAWDFTIKVTEARMRGPVDKGLVLASTAANELLRAYFDRITIAVNEGQFDPDHILDVELNYGEEET